MTRSNASRLLLIFLKEPIPGTVKTRLAQTRGNEDATHIYRALVTVLLQQLSGIKDCDIRFCYAPDDALESIQFWILPQLPNVTSSDGTYHIPQSDGSNTNITFSAQGAGDLGERLARAFRIGFNDGYKKIAVIGSDCPYISNRWIETSFTVCKDNCVPIGPALDGGYYLMVLDAMIEEAFQHIPWSDAKTLKTTIQQIESVGKQITLLPELRDIDHEADWEDALYSPLGKALKTAYKNETQS